MRSHEVGIVGGGPAGAALATLLAQGGVSVVLLEAARFPRPHVGESLVPAANRVLDEMGFLPRMDELGFLRKHGATWKRAASRARPHRMDFAESVSLRFAERAQPGVPQGYTWHVDRGRFDAALLEHARAAGAEVHEGRRVRRVDLQEPALVAEDGERFAVGMVADASGRGRLLGRQLGLEQRDPDFDQYALHAWFRSYRRTEEPADDIVIRFMDERGSWMWQIPIAEDVTSLGVVFPKRRLKGTTKEALWAKIVAADPDCAARVAAAEQLGELRAEADYSYTMGRFSGERYVLLGDAARFVDPIFSSGVSIALTSASLACRAILAKEGFGDFEATMQRGVAHWHAFIRLYYRLDVLFSWFAQRQPYRSQLLQLLQGDVYDEEEPAVLGLMRDKLAQVEADPKHMWHGLLSW